MIQHRAAGKAQGAVPDFSQHRKVRRVLCPRSKETRYRGAKGRPVEHIRRRAKVGNLYVNRNQIGAVVGVQPFGGENLSGTGPKAGGPHYLLRFATERTFTVNTTAAGGNASLLTLQD